MKKNMNENFEKLKERVDYSLKHTDLEKMNYELSQIQGATLVSGVGGSSVVSSYASKILAYKNHIITRNIEPRDFMFLNIDNYKNVLACSYSGNNYGVNLAFLNDLDHYLLSGIENQNSNIRNLTYTCMDNEKSFISLAATLIPCSILLNYYLNDVDSILDVIYERDFDFDPSCDAYEIFSGLETSTAAKYLESTMVESGIGIPIVHDKYSYAHGRSTTSTVYHNIAIYLNCGTELDAFYLNELAQYYKELVVLNASCDVIGEFSLLVDCMYLTKYIAMKNNKDICGVDYNPIVKKIYKIQKW